VGSFHDEKERTKTLVKEANGSDPSRTGILPQITSSTNGCYAGMDRPPPRRYALLSFSAYRSQNSFTKMSGETHHTESTTSTAEKNVRTSGVESNRLNLTVAMVS
jgi:hypothetical protein